MYSYKVVLIRMILFIIRVPFSYNMASNLIFLG